MAVYNVEKYIADTIESIIAQDIGFENVQLILVDDCSKDSSFEICRSYAEKYPDNIIAIQLPENSGNASAPRNVAMQYVEGKYISCTDSDDLLTPNALSCVWNFFEEHEDRTDMVAIPIDMFYNNDVRITVPTARNSFIKDKSRVIDLEEEWKCLIASVATVFCHARVKDFYKFDPTIINGEDLIVANKILLEKRTLGLVAGCTYLYRQHVATDTQESLIQQGQKKKSWYTHSIKHITLDMIDYAEKRFGELPKFYQYCLASDLQWRLIARHKASTLMNEEELDEFYEVLTEAFMRFDYNIIMALVRLPITEKIYILRKKYVRDLQKKQEKVDTDLLFSFPPTVHFYDLKKHSDGTVELFGDYNDVLYENLYELEAYFDSGSSIEMTMSDKTINTYIHKEIMYVKRMFSIKIDLKDVKPYSKLKFRFKHCNYYINTVVTGVGRFPINPEFSGSYYFIKKFVLRFDGKALCFDKKKIYSSLTCEARYIKSILKKTSDNKLKIIAHRFLYKFFSLFYKRKKIWLVSDKADRADDNGEFFFKYLTKNKRRRDKCYFVIRKDSVDFDRMKKVGKCVSYLSYKHKILSMFATYLVSAHTHDDFRHPLGLYHKYMLDVAHRNRFIFLQHGIIKSDHSKVLNKFNIDIAMFVTSSEGERDSIVNGNYGYTEDEVALCGMARYDGLYSDTEKLITIAPTWRYNLCGIMDDRTDIYPLKPEFDNSIYYTFFKSLLTSERLMAAAKEYGYRIQFLPHPILFPHRERFEVNPEIKVLGYGTSFKEVYAKSALMLTDYSSLVFDFAYLKKPIVYTLFDYYDQSNAYVSDGYYDHERDGLGDVTYTLEDTVDCLIEYMKNDCKLKDKYLERIEKFYAFKDRNNAERVYEAVLALEAREFFGI